MIDENDKFFTINYVVCKLILQWKPKKIFFLKNPIEDLLQIGNWRLYLNPSIELWKDFADALFFIRLASSPSVSSKGVHFCG